MSVIKLTATIGLQGGTMYGEDVCQSDKKNLYDHNIIVVEGKTNNNRKNPNDKEVLHYFTRRSIPARQSINMTDEAYAYMTSNEVPDFSNKSLWSKMSKMQRLEAHLKETAKSLNGELISFNVYPD